MYCLCSVLSQHPIIFLCLLYYISIYIVYMYTYVELDILEILSQLSALVITRTKNTPIVHFLDACNAAS